MYTSNWISFFLWVLSSKNDNRIFGLFVQFFVTFDNLWLRQQRRRCMVDYATTSACLLRCEFTKKKTRKTCFRPRKRSRKKEKRKKTRSRQRKFFFFLDRFLGWERVIFLFSLFFDRFLGRKHVFLFSFINSHLSTV